MNIAIIAAVTADNAIGRGGDLIFHIREDLKRFKTLTMGHTVIMGRHTWDSLPNGALPGRRNIVVTRNRSLSFPGAESAASLPDAIELARAAGETEAFIIGGAQIYDAAINLADRLELTMIDATAPDADVHFPAVDPTLWQQTDATGPFTDEKTGVSYRFVCFSRK